MPGIIFHREELRPDVLVNTRNALYFTGTQFSSKSTSRRRFHSLFRRNSSSSRVRFDAFAT